MKMTTRYPWTGDRAALAAACLLALAGCRDADTPGEAEDHIGHVIPAHKPRTFPQAVRSLRELNDQIRGTVVQGQPGRLPDETPLNIARDIANWLPEIAADSDMPETPWNEVNTRSATIVADYQAIPSGPPTGDPSVRIQDAGQAISGLESLLAAADPRWFAGTPRSGEALSSEAAAGERR